MAKCKNFKKRTVIKAMIIIAVLVICSVAVIGYFKGNILPVVLVMSEATVKALTVDAINSASHQIVAESLKYTDLVHIERNADGSIEMVQTNTIMINRMTRDLAILSQANVEAITNRNISLPLGAFTGSVVLSGVGPEVEIALMPIGSVACDFISQFEEVGINQTRHSIYINVNATISLVLPVSSVPVHTTTTILVCENIIVGKVPDVYFNSSGSNSPLDLIP